MTRSDSPSALKASLATNKTLAGVLFALMAGGGLGTNELMKLPDREEIRKIIKSETKTIVDDAIFRAQVENDNRIREALNKLTEKTRRLQTTIDHMVPMVAAVAPLARRSHAARKVYEQAQIDIQDGHDPLENGIK